MLAQDAQDGNADAAGQLHHIALPDLAASALLRLPVHPHKPGIHRPLRIAPGRRIPGRFEQLQQVDVLRAEFEHFFGHRTAGRAVPRSG